MPVLVVPSTDVEVGVLHENGMLNRAQPRPRVGTELLGEDRAGPSYGIHRPAGTPHQSYWLDEHCTFAACAC